MCIQTFTGSGPRDATLRHFHLHHPPSWTGDMMNRWPWIVPKWLHVDINGPTGWQQHRSCHLPWSSAVHSDYTRICSIAPLFFLGPRKRPANSLNLHALLGSHAQRICYCGAGRLCVMPAPSIGCRTVTAAKRPVTHRKSIRDSDHCGPVVTYRFFQPGAEYPSDSSTQQQQPHACTVRAAPCLRAFHTHHVPPGLV